MALNLYRRHGSDCAGGRPHQATTYESDGIRRSWKRCLCPIYASGTIDRRFKRRNTERADWADAKAVVRAWEEAASWDGVAKVPAHPAPEPPAAEGGRITIDRAIAAFTMEYQEHAANTQKNYRLLLVSMKAFSDHRGFAMIDQWGPIDVREFRSSWPVSPQTAVKKMSTVKTFFEFCVSNEWIARNPARLVKNPRGRDAADRRSEQKPSLHGFRA
jgi:hypothetical protein